MNVLILGVNGFVGNALTRRILEQTDWKVSGMDLSANKLEGCVGHPRFEFVEGDITIHREWVEYHVKKADVVLPLVAIATPAIYVKDPLSVFELDFEENLRIVRLCLKYKKRLLFPSTSEVYGASPDSVFNEETSPLVYGPIHKTRWIYACSKQLLDRVIFAYGMQQGLRFTLFRPFNWIGPKLDSVNAAKEGSSRVITQFIASLLEGRPLSLVDGGEQRRCFTWVGDGVDGLMRIIGSQDGSSDGKIFNLGNPEGECSIRELADTLAKIYESRKARLSHYHPPRIEVVPAAEHYGKGFDDILARKPSIENARTLLGWEPKTALADAVEMTFDAFLAEHEAGQTNGSTSAA